MTAAQQRAMRELWPRFGIDFRFRPLDLDAEFGRRAPRVLEIGFGNGETLIEQAAQHPDLDYIGIEVHEPGIGHCLLHADAAGTHNLRLIAHDAIEVLRLQVPPHSLARINLYFPDPWPKKRHHKRRIVDSRFLDLCSKRLAAGGHLHIATDWADYAAQIDEVICRSQKFRLVERRRHTGDAPLERPTTKFERRGLTRGHSITDWQLARL